MKKMKSIGIRRLKDSLSTVLREAQEGTTFLITDREEVVAQISRPNLISLEGTKGALLAEWVANKSVRLPAQQIKRLKRPGIRLKSGFSKDILDDLRGE